MCIACYATKGANFTISAELPPMGMVKKAEKVPVSVTFQRDSWFPLEQGIAVFFNRLVKYAEEEEADPVKVIEQFSRISGFDNPSDSIRVIMEWLAVIKIALEVGTERDTAPDDSVRNSETSKG